MAHGFLCIGCILFSIFLMSAYCAWYFIRVRNTPSVF